VPAIWSLPGYTVLAPERRSAAWRGRDARTGAEVRLLRLAARDVVAVDEGFVVVTDPQPGTAPAPVPVRDRRRWPGRLVIAGLLGLAIALGAAWGRSAATRPAGWPGAGADWTGLLGRLDADRAAAFVTADPGELARADAAGSALLSADLAGFASLGASGAHARGFSIRVLSARVVAAGRGTELLRVIDTASPYDLLDRSGRLLEAVPGRGPTAWLVTLVSTAAGWRLASVLPAS